jgi:ankyrin repeat/BTB/POZ domain-containing protein 1
MSNVVRKQELELALVAEQKEIDAGFLKEDNPLDLSPGFRELCDACRRGDLKVCHEKLLEGVNINGRDQVHAAPAELLCTSLTPLTV